MQAAIISAFHPVFPNIGRLCQAAGTELILTHQEKLRQAAVLTALLVQQPGGANIPCVLRSP
ncbi:MAG: hypothetical protein ACTS73_09485 [Arsenophonus sp. NEOnobi-MAG3]